MPVARGERFECAMSESAGIWGCGVALVVTGAASAAAQQPTPADPVGGRLGAGGRRARRPRQRRRTAGATRRRPATKEKPPEEQAADTGGLVDFFKSTELTGFVDAYYGWNFNESRPAAAELRHQPQRVQLRAGGGGAREEGDRETAASGSASISMPARRPTW